MMVTLKYVFTERLSQKFKNIKSDGKEQRERSDSHADESSSNCYIAIKNYISYDFSLCLFLHSFQKSNKSQTINFKYGKKIKKMIATKSINCISFFHACHSHVYFKNI